MKQTIKLAELISTDIRSRNNAKRITETTDSATNYLLDFTGVEFMSRSFSDELCIIIDSHNNISVDEATMTEEVRSIYKIVNGSRLTKKNRKSTKSKITVLKTPEEVSSYFASF